MMNNEEKEYHLQVFMLDFKMAMILLKSVEK